MELHEGWLARCLTVLQNTDKGGNPSSLVFRLQLDCIAPLGKSREGGNYFRMKL